MTPFSTIGLFSKDNDERISVALKTLHRFFNQHNFQVYTDKTSARFLGLDASSDQEIAEAIDIAIVVGGDGTLLKIGRFLSEYSIPIIGINLGRLGFLVDISPDQIIAQLDAMFKGKCIKESRSLLHASAYRGDTLLGEGCAVNDVVFHVRNDIRMIEFTTHIDGKFVNRQRADGIVVATPTGSTAYSLSGGGPILHPGLDAVVLVPICPHTLSNRPIVVSNKGVIEISLCESREVNSRLSFDGQANIELRAGDKVIIRQNKHRLTLIHPEEYDYYRILRNKLGWSVAP
ncbi:MAG: NAD(+) kinase [Cocleimonas sp.]|nr:NAD(+) kinase [Cocleimonas sp.]